MSRFGQKIRRRLTCNGVAVLLSGDVGTVLPRRKYLMRFALERAVTEVLEYNLLIYSSDCYLE